MPSGPVSASERIASIDVLRGVALCGILVVNIQLMADIQAVLFNPFAYGDMSGLNRLVWVGTTLLFDQKFMTLFSMLFGAGIVLMAERRRATGRSAVGLHYRRMFWLVWLGLIHGYLLWYGEILFLYSVCGMLVYPFNRLRVRWLIPLGLLVIAVGSVLSVASGLSVEFWPEEQVLEMAQDFNPPAEVVQAELTAYRSGWLGQMDNRVPAYFEFHTLVLLFWGVWRAGGLMLLGMGLFKLGYFQARLKLGRYIAVAGIGLVLGLPVIAYWVWLRLQFEIPPDDLTTVVRSFFLDSQLNYWASLPVSLGYAALVMVWCRAGGFSRLRSSLAAVGQMALTNYFMQTILCTALFYGHGFGLFGKVDRIGQFGVVVAVWIVQLVGSPIWLARFRFGPLEWAWRSLTYWRRQPLRR